MAKIKVFSTLPNSISLRIYKNDKHEKTGVVNSTVLKEVVINGRNSIFKKYKIHTNELPETLVDEEIWNEFVKSKNVYIQRGQIFTAKNEREAEKKSNDAQESNMDGLTEKKLKDRKKKDANKTKLV